MYYLLPIVLFIQINWTEHIIVNNFEGATDVYAVDLDQDNDIDVLGTAHLADEVAWWANDGNENFTKYIIDGSLDGAYSIYAIDLDQDNDIDVLGASWKADDITWWENDGEENFIKHTIDGNFDQARSVYAIDLDGDNDIDVLGGSTGADEIAWWENDGNENFTKYVIGVNFDFACSVYAIDLDQDNDIDVLGAATYDSTIAWWENWTDVYPVSIDIPSLVPEDTILNPQATVKNFGTMTANFDVTCTIEPGAYTSSYSVTDLASADSISITFPDEFIFESGAYEVTVYTQLADDENPENDTLEKIIETYDPGVAEGSSNVPQSFSLGLRSNPAKGKAVFNLTLPEAATIALRIYDVSGRLIDNLSGYRSAGQYNIPWSAKVDGIYFYTFESPGYKENGKLVILKERR